VRWGEEGQQRQIKVFSNCEEATLFLNGKSYGTRRRNSQDYPAAGLRWDLKFNKGENIVRVIARKGTVTVEDSLQFQYQTEKWGKPSQVKIEKTGEENGIATVRARLLDENGIPCLDAADWVTFGLTGDGRLIDNQGTSSGSHYIQAANGQAIIRLHTNGGHSVVSVKAAKLPAVFLNL
jgi:beta-galactosidase